MATKILIVEDEFILAMSTQLTLQEKGFIVVGITSRGEEAINIARSEKPDVILMDITLAGDIDGLEATNVILEKTTSKVIFLTGNSDESTLERAMKINPAAILHKPVDDAQLIAAVSAV